MIWWFIPTLQELLQEGYWDTCLEIVESESLSPYSSPLCSCVDLSLSLSLSLSPPSLSRGWGYGSSWGGPGYSYGRRPYSGGWGSSGGWGEGSGFSSGSRRSGGSSSRTTSGMTTVYIQLLSLHHNYIICHFCFLSRIWWHKQTLVANSLTVLSIASCVHVRVAIISSVH